MNCIIIEDQPPAQRILKKYLNDVGTIQLLEVFSDPFKAIAFLQANPVDLLFLDINLPRLSGIDLVKTLSSKPQIIFTTAYSDYALDGFELDVVDFLLKPFSFERFLKAIGKLNWKSEPRLRAQQQQKREHFIKIGYDHVRLNFDDIFYLNADGDYCEIITSEKKYLSSEPLKKWTDLLGDDDFFRIHKSYVINLRKIVKINSSSVYLQNGIELPIGRNFKDIFFRKIVKP
jgi:DNA-binding LytR/AlgR family response regulator